jgi:hypothetical protein
MNRSCNSSLPWRHLAVGDSFTLFDVHVSPESIKPMNFELMLNRVVGNIFNLKWFATITQK